jgi:hypothetical protein
MTNRIIDVARNHNLTHEGTADQGSYGLAPYVTYNGSANYSHRPAGALKGIDGLTCGGWFQMTSGDALMGVWQTAANQVWRLFVNSSAPTFYVSGTGANSFTVAAANITAGQWYFVAARYTPSTEIAIWLNSTKSVNTTSIPASLFDSTTAEFVIGGDHGGANLLTGKAAMCWVSHEPLADNYLTVLYQMQRHLFGA